jgi:hypothetical protein
LPMQLVEFYINHLHVSTPNSLHSNQSSC